MIPWKAIKCLGFEKRIHGLNTDNLLPKRESLFHMSQSNDMQ
jgi:hypothetical protein